MPTNVNVGVHGVRFDHTNNLVAGAPLPNMNSWVSHHGVTCKDTWVARSNSRPLIVTRHRSY